MEHLLEDLTHAGELARLVSLYGKGMLGNS